MKILMLSWEYPPKIIGGIARHVQDLSRALVKAGHEVVVLTSDAPNVPEVHWDKDVLVYTVKNHIPPSMDFLTWVLHLNFAMISTAIPLMNENPPEIIHIHDWLTMYAGRVLKFAYKRPLIGTIHATEYGRNYGLHTPLQRYISDMEWTLAFESWRVICCSDAMKKEIQQVFQVPDDKLATIPNGVDPSNFTLKSKAERSLYAADNEKVVFFIGRLVREKGIQVLIEAASLVLTVIPNIKFIIAGTGPSADSLKQRAKDLNIYHRIYFTGYIDDATRNFLFNIADISVFPSLYEPFGIVALESMAAGTPIIVANTGGLSSIINHGKNGLKTVVDDPRSLADNILWALNHPTEMKEMANRATHEVEKKYNWAKIAKKTEEVYFKVFDEYQNSDWNENNQVIQTQPVQTAWPYLHGKEEYIQNRH